MARLLSTIVNPQKTQQPFVLLQSTNAHSCLPLLRGIVSQSLQQDRKILLFCFFYPPSRITSPSGQDSNVAVFDWTDDIPGYSNEWSDHQADVLDAIKDGEATFFP